VIRWEIFLRTRVSGGSSKQLFGYTILTDDFLKFTIRGRA
jgi:hypothetical protein